MIIRPATTDDISAVLPMVAKICALHESWDAAKYGFLPNPAQRYDRWLKKLVNDDGVVFLVADHESPLSDKLAGFLIATVEREIPIYRLQEFAFIHDIWVEPEYRQVGIAKQMVMLAIDKFKQMGIKQIRLDTSVANDTARSLFSACGFRVSTIEMLIELEP